MRLDASQTAPTDVSPDVLAQWVSRGTPNPRAITAVQWIEVLFNDATGAPMKVVLELEQQRFAVRSAEVVR